MGYSNEPEWTPWGAVGLAIEMIKSMTRSITQSERDPFVSGGIQLTAWMFSPFIILGFVLISFLWYLGKKAFNNRQR